MRMFFCLEGMDIELDFFMVVSFLWACALLVNVMAIGALQDKIFRRLAGLCDRLAVRDAVRDGGKV